ncbi:MAG: hypothetical protein KAH38_05805 [Candidatus Hydrogenedentes bacterium]|nr:hypothetical protein [Candidatus Hydrogenedentota bacterium]
MIISTFLPAAIGAENFRARLVDEEGTPSRFHLADALLPMQEDLLASMASEEATASAIRSLLEAAPAVSSKQFSPLPDATTFKSRETDLSAADRERNLRLARFLPKGSSHAGMLSSMDSMLAKAFEKRNNNSEEERMLLAFLRGSTTDNTLKLAANCPEHPVHPEHPEHPHGGPRKAQMLLEEGYEYLQQGDVSEAVLTFFDIVNRFPESDASVSLDTTMNALAWDAERGLVEIIELQQFADALPDYEDCKSDKSVFWLITAQQITGHALHEAGQDADALPYLEYASNVSLAAMKDMPESEYQIFIPGHYMLSCRDLGKGALKEAIRQLHIVIRNQTANNILKLASRQTLSTAYHRDFHDKVEAGLQCINLLDELANSKAITILEAQDASPNVLGHLEFVLGYTHFHLAQLSQARNHFSNIAAQYPDNYRLAEFSAYMVAYLTDLLETDSLNEVLSAYHAYITAYPDGANLYKALLYMAAVLYRMGELNSASEAYRYAVDLFPNAAWAAEASAIALELENAAASGAQTDILFQRISAEYGGNLCGPYALALLLNHQGMEADLGVLAEAAGSEGIGTSLSGLLDAATAAGLTAYVEKVDSISDLNSFEPFIAHLIEGHYVFVSSITATVIRFEDTSGERTLSPSEFNALFSGYAITLRNLDNGVFISQETLDSIRGGCASLFDGINEDYIFCVNQDYIPPCPVGGGGKAGANSPNSLGTLPPGPQANAGYIGVPGVMGSPANPSVHPNISFNGVNLGMGTNQRSIAMSQTDFSLDNVSKLDFSFRRTYYNPWGGHEAYKSEETRPFKNNIGSGWTHNFNVHLRISSGDEQVAFVDANGNFKRYVRSEENGGGYYIYRMGPLGTAEEDTNTLTHERSTIIRRDINQGWFEMIVPDGMTYHFSAPIHDEEKYSRLEWFKDTSGNKIHLWYQSHLVVTDIEEIDGGGHLELTTDFGRLYRVDAPEGDGRHLDFFYTGNQITRVELVEGEGDLLQSADYTYDGYKGTDDAYGLSFLRSVRKNDDDNDMIQFEYDDGEYDYGGSDGIQPVGLYPAKITDKNGNELLINFVEYENKGFILAREIEITYPIAF